MRAFTIVILKENPGTPSCVTGARDVRNATFIKFTESAQD